MPKSKGPQDDDNALLEVHLARRVEEVGGVNSLDDRTHFSLVLYSNRQLHINAQGTVNIEEAIAIPTPALTSLYRCTAAEQSPKDFVHSIIRNNPYANTLSSNPNTKILGGNNLQAPLDVMPHRSRMGPPGKGVLARVPKRKGGSPQDGTLASLSDAPTLSKRPKRAPKTVSSFVTPPTAEVSMPSSPLMVPLVTIIIPDHVPLPPIDSNPSTGEFLLPYLPYREAP
ncbi:hypothetical protein LIER_05925 [Lithospermum erythrorhizon]|uniref:Uncharacterized protein n=1 Tax=Lithospermum erythrorhizon TaxID=34254 RepID=A0AAV3P445_LITER